MRLMPLSTTTLAPVPTTSNRSSGLVPDWPPTSCSVPMPPWRKRSVVILALERGSQEWCSAATSPIM